MFRRLVFIIMGVIALSSYSQSVVYDQTSSTGVRTVICSGINTGISNSMDAYITLAGFKYKSTVRYSLAVSIGSSSAIDIPQNSVMFITLASGKVIECPTVAGGNSVLQSIDVELSDVYQTFKRFAYYNIKAKDLKKIVKSSVIQIEMQLNPSDYSVAFKNNQLGDVLISDFGILQNIFETD